jgi:hypothetical protein
LVLVDPVDQIRFDRWRRACGQGRVFDHDSPSSAGSALVGQHEFAFVSARS